VAVVVVVVVVEGRDPHPVGPRRSGPGFSAESLGADVGAEVGPEPEAEPELRGRLSEDRFEEAGARDSRWLWLWVGALSDWPDGLSASWEGGISGQTVGPVG
jgi:hypothetical protein